jgi:hypothetical protein
VQAPASASGAPDWRSGRASACTSLRPTARG